VQRDIADANAKQEEVKQELDGICRQEVGRCRLNR